MYGVQRRSETGTVKTRRSPEPDVYCWLVSMPAGVTTPLTPLLLHLGKRDMCDWKWSSEAQNKLYGKWDETKDHPNGIQPGT